MSFSFWALFPPAFSLFTAAGLWLIYFVALSDNRIDPLGSPHRGNGSLYPPYISVAGNFPPASCIFSGVMNLAACLGFVLALLRFIQIRHLKGTPWLNFISLMALSIGCFGMTIVGNFQVFTYMMIHNFGTFITFGFGALFCWLQSFITLRVNIKNEGKKVGIMRVLLSGVITVFVILFSRLTSQSLHLQAAQSQWALVMFFLIFLATFCIEFRHSSFNIMCTGSLGPDSGNGGVL